LVLSECYQSLSRLGDSDPHARTPSNFHNFTLFKPFNDRTVKRYMMDIDVAEPQVYGDIEWISVKIHGQSFMLHQIVSCCGMQPLSPLGPRVDHLRHRLQRKMISLAILMARTNTPVSLLDKAFG
jgi:tRNA pseudouridine38-40 synthase